MLIPGGSGEVVAPYIKDNITALDLYRLRLRAAQTYVRRFVRRTALASARFQNLAKQRKPGKISRASKQVTL